MDAKQNLDVIKAGVIGTAAKELLERGQQENFMVTTNSLQRYFMALAYARCKLAEQFDEDEMGMMLEAMNGVYTEGASDVLMFVQGIEDAMSFDDLGNDDEQDGAVASLIQKLHSLNFIERAALLDAIERWQLRLHKRCQPEISELLSAPTAYNGTVFFIK